MDYIKTGVLAAAVALVVAVGFANVGKDDNLGGVPGVSILPISQYPTAGMILATSTAGNSTLLTSEIDQENIIEMTLTGGAGTLTFPATSSFPGIPNPGDMRTIWVRNASTSAAANLTIAAGTGMTFKNGASSTVLLIGDTDGDNTMRLDFLRKPDSDVNVYLYKYQD